VAEIVTASGNAGPDRELCGEDKLNPHLVCSRPKGHLGGDLPHRAEPNWLDSMVKAASYGMSGEPFGDLDINYFNPRLKRWEVRWTEWDSQGRTVGISSHMQQGQMWVDHRAYADGAGEQDRIKEDWRWRWTGHEWRNRDGSWTDKIDRFSGIESECSVERGGEIGLIYCAVDMNREVVRGVAKWGWGTEGKGVVWVSNTVSVPWDGRYSGYLVP
jgi:hypothetical protein